MHYKYSSMMNITHITMMFGAGIPMLFPIAAAAFFVLYCLENFMLYYVYVEPPSYDEKLNDSVLKNLEKAPLMLLAFGYWMFSNNQLLNNDDDLTPIELMDSPFYAQHYWYQSFTPSGLFSNGPSGFLLFFFIFYYLYVFFNAPL